MGVLTEGFDDPGVSCLHMLRPTKSQPLYEQCLGRGLRPALGKAQPGEDCLVIDYLPRGWTALFRCANALGEAKPLTEADQDALEAAADDLAAGPGVILDAFTYDGTQMDYSGTPFEIVTRQLSFLDDSPLMWIRRDGWLMLSIGKGADGVDRTFAISPPNGDGQYELLGIGRRNGSENTSVIKSLLTGALPELGEEVAVKAREWDSNGLADKEARWRGQPASERQKDVLRKQGQRVTRGITRGEASDVITYLKTRQVLEAAGVWR